MSTPRGLPRHEGDIISTKGTVPGTRVQVFAHRFGLFLLHLLPGPKMPLATKLNSDRASDALTDDPFGTQSH